MYCTPSDYTQLYPAQLHRNKSHAHWLRWVCFLWLTGNEPVVSELHPRSEGQLWLPVFGELCSWCPRAPLDFWPSEQTAAGERGVKMSVRFLIDKAFKEFRGQDITLVRTQFTRSFECVSLCLPIAALVTDYRGGLGLTRLSVTQNIYRSYLLSTYERKWRCSVSLRTL